MGTPLVAAAQALVDDLRAAGVRATMDVRNVNPPTVLVTPPGFASDRVCGGTATWSTLVIGRGPANLDAWKQVDDLLAVVVGHVDNIRDIQPTSYVLEDGGPLPAYAISWVSAVEWKWIAQVV